MDNSTLSALAEIRKHLVLQAKFNNQIKNIYPDSYVYAIRKSVHPIFEEEILDNFGDEKEKLALHPFSQIYSISYNQVNEVNLFLNEKRNDEKDIKFKDLEEHYKNRWNVTDIQDCLIKICRYLYLSDALDKAFWNSLILNHRVEILQINKDFKISEVFPFLNS
ncbi:hypothetical protein [Nostoc sp. PA-18-2419]|uniref:hypothetical protein n=1 Tax=Nostoc sp. PA-18-2419 TaxID=2575443 RepID=UPI0011096ECE|nr:hypothetical protein [Nostoc sp. PA-18-2419]